MKYIRTKDGKIYDTKDITKCDDKRFPNGWFTEFGVALLSIKQADTIEELCDVLVVCDPQLLLPFIREKVGGDLYLHPSFEEKFKEGKLEAVYGSIWVNGNLIKVAQMNEKGELELL